MFYLVLGDYRIEYESLGKLVKTIEKEFSIDVDKTKGYDKVDIIIDPTVNYINHVFVMLGFNHTIGCPVEVFGKIPYEELVPIIKTGLSNSTWFILGSILASTPSSIDELFELLYEFIDFKYRKKTNRLKPIYDWRDVRRLKKYYVDAKEVFIDALRPINEDSIEILIDFMKKYWEKYYEKYWIETASKRLMRYRELLSKILPYTKPYELLIELTGLEPRFNSIKCYPVDVYRRGGEIYSAPPDKVIVTSETKYAVTAYTGIIHESGHLLIRGWEIKLYKYIEIFAEEIGMNTILSIPWSLEEMFMALLQRLADEKILGYHRFTHGLMNTKLFGLAYNTYRELEENNQINYYVFMKEYMENIMDRKEYIEEYKYILKTMFQ